MAALWPEMWFSIWRPPPSWILWDTSYQAKSCPRTYFQYLYQIWCKSVQKWRRYGRLTDFKMAAAAILDFCTMWILAVNMTVRHHFQPVFQIRCKCAQKWPSYGRLTDFKMAAAAILNLLPVSILAFGRLWILAGDVPVKFRVCTWIHRGP